MVDLSDQPRTFNQNFNDILATIQTDARAFRFENVPAKPLHESGSSKSPGTSWSWPSHIHCVATPACGATSQALTITLAPEAKIAGRVADQHGKPIPNATVTLNSSIRWAAIGHAPRMPIPASWS